MQSAVVHSIYSLTNYAVFELSASKLNASTTLTEGGHIKHLLEHRIVKLHWGKNRMLVEILLNIGKYENPS